MLVTVMVPEAEMNTAEVILSNFEFCSKMIWWSQILAEMNTAEVILSNFEFCFKK